MNLWCCCPEVASETEMLTGRTRLWRCGRRLSTGRHEPLHVSASIGVAVYPRDGQKDAASLLKNADTAMYRAKESGRDRFQFFQAA